MPLITPVLVCGGSGTHLLDLSRKQMPKHFAPRLAENTLYQSALKRLSGDGWAAPMVVTSAACVGLATDQAKAVGIAPACLMVEPSSRDTGPAILAAARHLAELDPEALMLVAPAGHTLPDPGAVSAGAPAASEDRIVVFPMSPSHGVTGDDWLEPGDANKDALTRPLAFDRFVGKVKAVLATGNAVWNSIAFLIRARTLIDAFHAFADDLFFLSPAVARKADLCGDVVCLIAGPREDAQEIPTRPAPQAGRFAGAASCRQTGGGPLPVFPVQTRFAVA